MAMSEQRKDYLYNYQKANLKRIPLDVQKEKYEEIKTAAAAAGEPVNGYIKKAVDMRMSAQQNEPEDTPKRFAAAHPAEPKSRRYAPLTPENIAKVDLSKIRNDVYYQAKILEAFGDDGLAQLYEMAGQQVDEAQDKTE